MYPTSIKALTKRQESVLDFLREFISVRGYAPSLREICAKFGIKSPKNAKKHLEAIEKKGFLKRSPNLSRAIELAGAPVKNTISVPVIGRVKAGQPHLAVADVTGHITLDAGFFNCSGAFILKADGESMNGAGINDGDFLLVRPGAEVFNNDIAVVMLDSESTVKRFLKKDGVITLKPENPEFKPVRVKNGAEFVVIGKVVSVIKQIENKPVKSKR